jgi:hypothetical protein
MISLYACVRARALMHGRLLLDLLRDVTRGTAAGVRAEGQLTMMQAMLLAHAPFWTRGGGGGGGGSAAA